MVLRNSRAIPWNDVKSECYDCKRAVEEIQGMCEIVMNNIQKQISHWDDFNTQNKNAGQRGATNAQLNKAHVKNWQEILNMLEDECGS